MYCLSCCVGKESSWIIKCSGESRSPGNGYARTHLIHCCYTAVTLSVHCCHTGVTLLSQLLSPASTLCTAYTTSFGNLSVIFLKKTFYSVNSCRTPLGSTQKQKQINFFCFCRQHFQGGCSRRAHTRRKSDGNNRQHAPSYPKVGAIHCENTVTKL
jgi:hypothetical protein